VIWGRVEWFRGEWSVSRNSGVIQGRVEWFGGEWTEPEERGVVDPGTRTRTTRFMSAGRAWPLCPLNKLN